MCYGRETIIILSLEEIGFPSDFLVNWYLLTKAFKQDYDSIARQNSEVRMTTGSIEERGF